MLECFLFFGSHFFLGLVPSCTKVFSLLLLTVELLSSPICSCLHFHIRGKPTCSDWAAKWESKRFHHFLTSPHSTLLPPFVRLWPTLHVPMLPGFLWNYILLSTVPLNNRPVKHNSYGIHETDTNWHHTYIRLDLLKKCKKMSPAISAFSCSCNIKWRLKSTKLVSNCNYKRYHS